ncbi:Hypothetical protein Minf_0776 [Methylacidiphilum infernorum V4]|uniref:Uncharacterized protein n=1 Tax=Methylacidiphilum infernorum (isolate V4) TaxID=481448 RepID=B3E0S7_METI4|nr:Hypothetical protein Minf_0776 [Methylacidiphilum infernorum V4]
MRTEKRQGDAQAMDLFLVHISKKRVISIGFFP